MERVDAKSLAFRIAKRNFPDDRVDAEWNKDNTQVILSVRRGRMVRLTRIPVNVEEFEFSFNVQKECNELKDRLKNDRETVPAC